MQEDSLKLFWYWINERHRIYHKYKVLGDPWPWSDDPIFQTYSFCNVYRELDSVTIWIREQWREPFAHHPKLFFNMCLARQFNWPPTLDYLGFMDNDSDIGGVAMAGVWNVDQIIRDLQYRKDQGAKIFTGAYMLTGTIRDEEGNSMPKVRQIVEYVLDPIWREEELYAPQPGDTLQQAWKRLKTAMGFGPFLAYEVVTDLRHTRYLRGPADVMTWANAGPGAMRGINRLHGLPARPNRQFDDSYYQQCMLWLLQEHSLRLQSHFQDYPMFEMREIEHCLCEYDKYCRAKFDGSRLRKRFLPPHER